MISNCVQPLGHCPVVHFSDKVKALMGVFHILESRFGCCRHLVISHSSASVLLSPLLLYYWCFCCFSVESKHLKTNATGGCLAYRTESIQRNERIRRATDQYPRQTSGTFIVATVKRRKLSWFGHVCHVRCQKSYHMEQLTSSRRRERPRKSWRDNIKELTGQSLWPLLRIADGRNRWATIAAEAYIAVLPTTLGHHEC